MDVKTFEEYLEKMGYSWDDFDRTYEMENLIEQYADEKVKQALTIHAVVEQSKQLPCQHCGQLEPCAGNSPETCYHPKVC